MKHNATKVEESGRKSPHILNFGIRQRSASCFRKFICWCIRWGLGLTVILNVVAKWRNSNNSESNVPPVQPITTHCTVLTPCSYSEKWKCETLPFLYFCSVHHLSLLRKTICPTYQQGDRIDFVWIIFSSFSFLSVTILSTLQRMLFQRTYPIMTPCNGYKQWLATTILIILIANWWLF
jgi:hypothetical protein